MKKILLLYNPMAGMKEFNGMLDFTIEKFQVAGYELDIYRTRTQIDFFDYFKRENCRNYEAILVAGGDGSVSLALNGLLASGKKMPLGIIPAGTSNDFARTLGIEEDLEDAIIQLAKMRIKKIDIGKVNEQYFINVCGGGILPNLAQKVDREWKNAFGKLAYYLAGAIEISKYKTFKVKVKIDEQEFIEDYYLYIVMNGSVAGGFTRIAKEASVEDGMFDFIGIGATTISELPIVFSKILSGEHLKDRRVRYAKGKKIFIEYLEGDLETRNVNIDGELGPEYPIAIEVLNKELEVLY